MTILFWLSHKIGHIRFVCLLAIKPNRIELSWATDSHFSTKLSFWIAQKSDLLIAIDEKTKPFRRKIAVGL
jgi:hypothetical protein